MTRPLDSKPDTRPVWPRMLAPYLAVGIFWCGMHNAWLTILAYHLQVVLWSRRHPQHLSLPPTRRRLLLALPALLAGPVTYLLLPIVTQLNTATWLDNYGLQGWRFAAMVPYFGLVHPALEQCHWGPLRERTPLAHLMFAGYHMLVLSALVAPPFLVLILLLLAGMSVIWHRMSRPVGDMLFPVVSHTLADLGIVLAAWFWVYSGH